MKLPDIGDIGSLGVLFTLLPGLITYLVVRNLTDRAKKVEAVEAILHALAYTLIVNAIWELLTQIGSLVPTSDIVGLSLTAVVVGLVLAHSFNRGCLYRLMRRAGITTESSWTSIWDTALKEFKREHGEYAVLHLKDGRRVMGVICGFSSQQEDGHVCLDHVRWLDATATDAAQPGMHVFGAPDIAIIQLIPPKQGA